MCLVLLWQEVLRVGVAPSFSVFAVVYFVAVLGVPGIEPRAWRMLSKVLYH